jgi:hypothetical protein
MGSSSSTSDSLEPTSLGDVGTLARHATVAYRRSSDAQEIERPSCEASAVELLAGMHVKHIVAQPFLLRTRVGGHVMPCVQCH